MAARRSMPEKVPSPPQGRSEILRAIAGALTEWGKFATTGTAKDAPVGDEEKEAGRKALQLMEDNLGLLNECMGKYGCGWRLVGAFRLRLDWIDTARSWPDSTDLGEEEEWRKWREAFTRAMPDGQSVVSTVRRWADEVEKEGSPPDPISSAVAVKDYCVSRPTLRRAVVDGRLTDYRQKPHPANAGYILSRAEVAAHWPKRRP